MPFQGNSRSYKLQPSVFKGVEDCRLPAFRPLKRFKPSRRPFQGNSRSYTLQPSVSKGVQDCRLPAFKPLKRFKPSRRPFQGNSRSYTPQPSVFQGVEALFARRQTLPSNPPQAFPRQLSQLHAPAICFSGRWSSVWPPSNASNPSFKPFRRSFQGNSRSYTPQPSVFQGVQDCRLPAFKPLKPFKPSRKPFQGNSRSYMPQPSVFSGRWSSVCPPSNASFKPSAGLSKATLAATRPSHLFFRAFKRAVCSPSNFSNPSNLPAGLSKEGVEALFARRQTLQTLPSVRPFQRNSRSYMPQTMLQTLLQAFPRQLRSYTPQPSVFKGVQDYRLPALKPLKPVKPFRRRFQGNSCSFPQAFPTQLSQLHAPDNVSNPSASLSKATLAATRRT